MTTGKYNPKDFMATDDFSAACKTMSYDVFIDAIKTRLIEQSETDIIYIGIGVGNPDGAFPSTNNTAAIASDEPLFSQQCYPEFLNSSNYKMPFSICVNSDILPVSGKQQNFQQIKTPFPLNYNPSENFSSIDPKELPTIVILNAVSQVDYPGIIAFAVALNAYYLKSYGALNNGAVTDGAKFIKKMICAFKMDVPHSLGDKKLLEAIDDKINS